MAGKGAGGGQGDLDNQISVMKYLLLFTNIIIWVRSKYLRSSVILYWLCHSPV